MGVCSKVGYITFVKYSRNGSSTYHLEIGNSDISNVWSFHDSIRHLEKATASVITSRVIHDSIHHLEYHKTRCTFLGFTNNNTNEFKNY